MADNTKIEWADATLNAVNGCSVVSPGCTNCYAMRLAGTRLKHHPSRAGLTQDSKAGPVWTGEVRLHEPALLQALRWRRPRQIFWNAHGDLFHPAVPDEWIDRLFAVCALTPQHTHMILTKRPERMREYVTSLYGRSFQDVLDHFLRNEPQPRGGWAGENFDQQLALKFPLPNVWLGTSVEDQQRADERLDDLRDTPAAVHFVSIEPLLGPIDLTQWLICPNARDGLLMDPITGAYECCSRCDWTGLQSVIDWVIVGGESGPGARPMHPDWARSLRDQCQAACVAFHFKQWGDWAAGEPLEIAGGARDCPDGTIERAGPSLCYAGRGRTAIPKRHVGKARAGRLLDGREWNEVPA